MKPPAQAVGVDARLPDLVGECECGKRSYRTKAAAKAAAKRVQTQVGGGRLTVYRCPRNVYWHVGHASHGANAIAPERRRRR